VLGTQFDVRVISPESTDVTVEQGPVQVSCDGSNVARTAYFARLQANEVSEPTLVNASEGLLFESGLQFLHRIQPAEMEQRLSWQHKALRVRRE
jgi:ferric-dicitrate binding protein FerR (iron transport regulator)